MAKIIENKHGRRIIRLNTDDIINIVREFQSCTINSKTYKETRAKLDAIDLYLPEDI